MWMPYHSITQELRVFNYCICRITESFLISKLIFSTDKRMLHVKKNTVTHMVNYEKEFFDKKDNLKCAK